MQDTCRRPSVQGFRVPVKLLKLCAKVGVLNMHFSEKKVQSFHQVLKGFFAHERFRPTGLGLLKCFRWDDDLQQSHWGGAGRGLTPSLLSHDLYGCDLGLCTFNNLPR